MNKSSHVFPPILDHEKLPGNVLVLVAHPDDEIIGIGGLLAFHGRRGDSVRVVHASSGAAGDPLGRYENLGKTRQQEVKVALATLGLAAPSCLGYADGTLARHEEALISDIQAIFEEVRPTLLYSFHGGEFHADHRTVAKAACHARSVLQSGCMIQLFGVNQVPSFAQLYDYTNLVEKKTEALACFRSQLAYLDFASKVMQRDQAATVNIELAEITHCELVLRVDQESWPLHLENAERALDLSTAKAAGNAEMDSEGGSITT